MADEDFIHTNFRSNGLVEGMVLFENDGLGEWGVFQLKERGMVSAWHEMIERYLHTEREAVAALARLYPAEELEMRLSLYDNAVIDSQGNTVFYLILTEAQKHQALAALGFA